MNGIVINIDPVAFSLGHIHITWYGLIVMLAIMAAVGIAIWEGKRKGIQSETILALAPWAVVGGLIGARLFHVIDRWDLYAGNPLQIFAIQQGGLAIWGGIAGGALAVVIFARFKQIPIGKLADTLVPALLVAQIIGRFACIIDGDAAGGLTSLPWAFTYLNPGAMTPPGLWGLPTHPYPVYDQLWNLMGLGIALKLRHHFKTDGFLFLSYVSIYAVGRFVFTYVRQEKVWFWGLQEAQVLAIAILAAVAISMVYLHWKSRVRNVPEVSV